MITWTCGYIMGWVSMLAFSAWLERARPAEPTVHAGPTLPDLQKRLAEVHKYIVQRETVGPFVVWTESFGSEVTIHVDVPSTNFKVVQWYVNHYGLSCAWGNVSVGVAEQVRRLLANYVPVVERRAADERAALDRLVLPDAEPEVGSLTEASRAGDLARPA